MKIETLDDVMGLLVESKITGVELVVESPGNFYKKKKLGWQGDKYITLNFIFYIKEIEELTDLLFKFKRPIDIKLENGVASLYNTLDRDHAIYFKYCIAKRYKESGTFKFFLSKKRIRESFSFIISIIQNFSKSIEYISKMYKILTGGSGYPEFKFLADLFKDSIKEKMGNDTLLYLEALEI